MTERNETKATPSEEAQSQAPRPRVASELLRKPKSLQSFDDVVDEASWESFPASDPPGY